MAKQLNIAIAEPCHQRWSDMSKVDNGRHCNACSKVVIDFTAMSDQQLIDFFQRSKENVCGRFHNDQLRRDITIPKKKMPWVKYLFMVTIPTFLFINKGRTQGAPRLMTKTDTLVSPAVKDLTASRPIVVKQPESVSTIYGKVVNQLGEPIPFASIIVTGTKWGVAADSIGYFKLSNKNIGVVEKVTVSAIGYATQELLINSQSTAPTEVKLVELDNIFMGIVGTVVKVKKRPIAIIENKKEMVVYPSPLPSGSPIHIVVENWKQGYYAVILSHIGGAVVHQQKIWIDSEARLLDVNLPTVTPGTYIITLVGERRKSRYSTQVLIK